MGQALATAAPPARQPTPRLAPTAEAACTNFADVKQGLGDKFAVLADQEGIDSASVTLLVDVDAAGQFSAISVKSASNRAVAALARTAVRRLRCDTQGHAVQLLVPFSFRLAD